LLHDDSSAASCSDQANCGHAARLVGPSKLTQSRSRGADSHGGGYGTKMGKMLANLQPLGVLT
jgi:hypothetical protein